MSSISEPQLWADLGAERGWDLDPLTLSCKGSVASHLAVPGSHRELHLGQGKLSVATPLGKYILPSGDEHIRGLSCSCGEVTGHRAGSSIRARHHASLHASGMSPETSQW